MAVLTVGVLLMALSLALLVQVKAADLPLTLSTQVLEGTDQICPPQEEREEIRSQIALNVSTLLRDVVVPILDPPIPCGGDGWVRVAHLDMSDPSESCPTPWQLYTAPQRACGAGGGPRCGGVTYSSNGAQYSQVCGRIFAFPRSTVQAFRGGQYSIDEYYVDGVSVTHGSPRQHIWTFAAGNGGNAVYKCPCDGGDPTIPSFVGDDYFCEGSQESSSGSTTDVILWDGEDCVPDSDCCSFNSPPQFTVQLPATTSNDIEVRICSGRLPSTGGANSEDTPIVLMEIYVK